jgi:hypothetical protein
MGMVVKNAVRKSLRGYRVGGDFFKELDAKISWKIKRAQERAKANGRKTLRACDL